MAKKKKKPSKAAKRKERLRKAQQWLKSCAPHDLVAEYMAKFKVAESCALSELKKLSTKIDTNQIDLPTVLAQYDSVQEQALEKKRLRHEQLVSDWLVRLESLNIKVDLNTFDDCLELNRMKKKQRHRIRRAKKWIVTYTETDLFAAYRKKFSLDSKQALKDLDVVGIQLEEEQLAKLKQVIEQAELNKAREFAEKQERKLQERIKRKQILAEEYNNLRAFPSWYDEGGDYELSTDQIEYLREQGDEYCEDFNLYVYEVDEINYELYDAHKVDKRLEESGFFSSVREALSEKVTKPPVTAPLSIGVSEIDYFRPPKPHNRKKRGHWCHVCGETKANEKFSGKGHAKHICKACAKLPKKKEFDPDDVYEEVFRLPETVTYL